MTIYLFCYRAPPNLYKTRKILALKKNSTYLEAFISSCTCPYATTLRLRGCLSMNVGLSLILRATDAKIAKNYRVPRLRLYIPIVTMRPFFPFTVDGGVGPNKTANGNTLNHRHQSLRAKTLFCYH